MIRSQLKTPILLLFMSFFIFGFKAKDKRFTSDDILLRSRFALLNVKSANYTCSFMQKFAGGRDTLKTNANIFMEKKKQDTLLRCNLKMTSQFTFYALTFKTELFYNGKKNISLNHTRKKATVDTVGARGNGKPTIDLLNQNFPTADLMNHYTESLPFEPFFKTGTKINTLEDEQVGDYLCYKIKIITKDSQTNNRRVTTLYIDKHSFLPVRRIDLVDVNKQQQYSDFTLSEIKTNNPAIISKIKEPAIPRDYSVDYYHLNRY
jgi:hypothetical protein